MLLVVNSDTADPEWLAALKTAVIVLDPAPTPRLTPRPMIHRLAASSATATLN